MTIRPLLVAVALGAAAALACADDPASGPLFGGSQSREWPGTAICPTPRPQFCAREQRPVCARYKNGTRRTYSSPCKACMDSQVIDYRLGQCPAPGERSAPIRP
jgi:hypothetical protein